MKSENYSKLFTILCALNITCLLISNIITVKTINIIGLIFTAGDILFPITYILNDIFTEVYGFEKSKFVIWLSFLCNLLMVIVFIITIKLPADKNFEMQEAIVNIFSRTPQMLLASFLSFLLGSFSNSLILSKMKVKTKGKFLALRTITSTIVGEGFDTIIFISIAFGNVLDLKSLIFLSIDTYVLKVLIEVILTPITYKVINIIKKKENKDVYDDKIKYTIL